MRFSILAIFLFAFLTPTIACAEELSVAAAADLNFALKEIAQKYQQDTGNTLKLSFGSSGNFYVQIENGAPFDVFLSADAQYPVKLHQAGLTLDPWQYAAGKLAIWAPKDSKLNLKKGLDRLEVLLDPSIHKIAIANPQHAPYGRAAQAALQKAGIWDRVKGKVVFGENISQTAQFVQTGNADVGMVALSIAMAPTFKAEGKYVQVPDDLYPPLLQDAVILKSSKKIAAATQFLHYLMNPAATKIMQKYGFVVATTKSLEGAKDQHGVEPAKRK